jgi:hypothetical protein
MILGVLLLLLLSWHFGFQRTIQLYSRYLILHDKADQQVQYSAGQDRLTGRLNDLRQHLGGADVPENEIRQDILNRLTILGNKYRFYIVGIPAVYAYNREGYRVMINTFILEGSFDQLLKVLYELEMQSFSERIISVKWSVKKSYQSKATKLYMTLFFQHFQK